MTKNIKGGRLILLLFIVRVKLCLRDAQKLLFICIESKGRRNQYIGSLNIKFQYNKYGLFNSALRLLPAK
jgi:hypothetical protein